MHYVMLYLCLRQGTSLITFCTDLNQISYSWWKGRFRTVSKMKCLTLFVAIICVLSPSCQETENNNIDCEPAFRQHILTCHGLHAEIPILEPHIKDSTHILILKNFTNLIFSSNTSSDNFRQVVNLQLINNLNVNIHMKGLKIFPNLKYIKFENNKLDVLKTNTFEGLNNVEILNIIKNQIGQLEKQAFAGLNDLITLEMTHNDITSLHNRMFESCKNLESLFLSHNKIEHILPESFIGLSNLKHLDLSYNKLKEISTQSFNVLTKLNYLYLEFNNIQTVNGNFVLPNLKFLYLHNNRLEEISQTLLNDSPNLIEVDLSNNNIKYLSEKSFENLLSLNHLNIKGNSLNITSKDQLNLPPYVLLTY